MLVVVTVATKKSQVWQEVACGSLEMLKDGAFSRRPSVNTTFEGMSLREIPHVRHWHVALCFAHKYSKYVLSEVPKRLLLQTKTIDRYEEVTGGGGVSKLQPYVCALCVLP